MFCASAHIHKEMHRCRTGFIRHKSGPPLYACMFYNLFFDLSCGRGASFHSACVDLSWAFEQPCLDPQVWNSLFSRSPIDGHLGCMQSACLLCAVIFHLSLCTFESIICRIMTQERNTGLNNHTVSPYSSVPPARL